jgi:Cys-rich four helix bundle protein (predicted Tat secretion target)
MLAAGAGTVLLALVDVARADDTKSPSGAPTIPAGLLDAIATCIAKSLACAAHCQAQLAAGNTSFTHCNQAVTDMIDVARATESLVARKSVTAKKMADTCAAACKECSAACLEHKAHFAHGMHMECKACMEACDACAKACAAFAAS